MESNFALELSQIDLGIIVIYFFVVLAIGLRMSRGQESGEDLFLAGRNLGWISIGFSLFASNISSTTLIGLVGAAYTGGLYVSNYEWMATVVLVFFVFYYVPIFIRSRITTIPEFLERRFGPASRKYFSGLTIITSVMVDTAGSLYAGAIVLNIFFPQLDLFFTCIVLAVVAGLYTAAGGLAAVVYTDVIQAVVLLLGSTLLTYNVFAHEAINFSWETIQAGLGGDYDAMFSVVNPTHHPLNDPNLPWLGTLVGVPILGFYFWVTNQYIAQRVLGAKDEDNARWGALLGGLLKLPVIFIMVLPGVLAKLIFPDLTNGDQVFPTLVTQLLPVGVIGLVLAGLVAAIMSSIDSTLNSASALVTLDFVKPAKPDLTDKQVAMVGRITMGVIMVVAALWAPQIANFQGLFAYLQEMLAYLVPPVAVLFLLGVFRPGGSGHTALATLIGGHIASVLTFALQKAGVLPDLHFTIVAGILFVVSGLIYMATLSWGDAKPEEEVRDLMVTAGSSPAQPGWKSYKRQSAVLMVLTAMLVIVFW